MKKTIWAFAATFSLVNLASAEVKDETANFKVAEGFKLERIYDVKKEEGSWVAMTVDGKGRLIVGDQYGLLYRVTVPALKGGKTVVEPLPISLQGSHGLLWKDGILYVSINERAPQNNPSQTGVWMVKETADGWEEPVLIKAIKAGGEHGVHSIVESPDGEWLYFVTGNYGQPIEFDDSFPAKVWDEDQLLPRNPDGRGHASNVMAPGGWVARFRPDGTNWQLVAVGNRNTYDIAFHDSGELFAYDADMEWDFGMPWYRPTRIMHVLPGSEFGWRNGTGKWPNYYEDSNEPVLDIGPGSPTGLLAGRGFKAPAKYQQAIYAYDWTFATIYAITLEPDGAGFKATSEEFVAGAGLPLTNGVIGADGAMYFATGGRRTASALWRVVYTGNEPTSPTPAQVPAHTHRDKLATFIEAPATADLDLVWNLLGSDDRTLRFMARATLERLPLANWANRLENESNPWKIMLGSMALARLDGKANRELALNALDRIEWSSLSLQQKLTWLRSAGLIFIRSGEPNDQEKARVIAKIDSAFPSNEDNLDRELARMLCYLQAPGIVGKVLDLMDKAPGPEVPAWAELISRNAHYGGDLSRMMKNHPPTVHIHYLYCLRVVKGPWEVSERRRTFDWFREIATRQGGKSYSLFIERFREDIFMTSTPEERSLFAADAKAPQSEKLQNLPQVEGPGRDWSVDAVAKLAEEGLEGRDRDNGRRMYLATLCSACHLFEGEGGGSGPDLTNLAGRFTVRDIAEAIIDPNRVVSDQYAFSEITTHDGKMIFGKILNEQDKVLAIGINPFDLSQSTEVQRTDIKQIKLSEISPMPGGLINRLNPDELKDLLAYMLGKE